MFTMKKSIFFISAFLFSIFSYTQTNEGISYQNWSNKAVFEAGKTPNITGYGTKSKELKVKFGSTYFVSNGEYYEINTAADYYYWFTNEYGYLFDQPDMYEFFYLTKNNIEMVRYLADHYNRERYPLEINFENIGNIDNNAAFTLINDSENSVNSEDIKRSRYASEQINSTSYKNSSIDKRNNNIQETNSSSESNESSPSNGNASEVK